MYSSVINIIIDTSINQNIFSKQLKRRKGYLMPTSYPKLVKMKLKHQLESLEVEESN